MGAVAYCFHLTEIDMPKQQQFKYYAVAVGLGGPFVYDSWAKAKPMVIGFPNNCYQGFHTQEEADQFLLDHQAAIDAINVEMVAKMILNLDLSAKDFKTLSAQTAAIAEKKEKEEKKKGKKKEKKEEEEEKKKEGKN